MRTTEEESRVEWKRCNEDLSKWGEIGKLTEKLGSFVGENLSIGQSHDHREELEKDTVAERTANRLLKKIKRRFFSFENSQLQANVRTMLSFSHDISSVATAITLKATLIGFCILKCRLSQHWASLRHFTQFDLKDSSRQRNQYLQFCDSSLALHSEENVSSLPKQIKMTWLPP